MDQTILDYTSMVRNAINEYRNGSASTDALQSAIDALSDYVNRQHAGEYSRVMSTVKNLNLTQPLTLGTMDADVIATIKRCGPSALTAHLVFCGWPSDAIDNAIDDVANAMANATDHRSAFAAYVDGLVAQYPQSSESSAERAARLFAMDESETTPEAQPEPKRAPLTTQGIPNDVTAKHASTEGKASGYIQCHHTLMDAHNAQLRTPSGAVITYDEEGNPSSISFDYKRGQRYPDNTQYVPHGTVEAVRSQPAGINSRWYRVHNVTRGVVEEYQWRVRESPEGKRTRQAIKGKA